jgi:hypothetical protein
VPKAKKLDGMTEEEKKAHFQARAAKAAASRAANKAAKAADPTSTTAAAAQSDMIDLDMEDQFEEIAVALDKTPAAPAAAPAAPAAPAVVEEVEEYKWDHDFGDGVKTYGRMDDDDGMSYIYDGTTGAYLGAYMEKTNKLNPKIPDPCTAE